jgi:hypothetical protein
MIEKMERHMTLVEMMASRVLIPILRFIKYGYGTSSSLGTECA